MNVLESKPNLSTFYDFGLGMLFDRENDCEQILEKKNTAESQKNICKYASKATLSIPYYLIMSKIKFSECIHFHR